MRARTTGSDPSGLLGLKAHQHSFDSKDPLSWKILSAGVFQQYVCLSSQWIVWLTQTEEQTPKNVDIFFFHCKKLKRWPCWSASCCILSPFLTSCTAIQPHECVKAVEILNYITVYDFQRVSGCFHLRFGRQPVCHCRPFVWLPVPSSSSCPGGRVKTWKRRWFILTDNCLYYFEYTTVSDSAGAMITVADIQDGI